MTALRTYVDWNWNFTNKQIQTVENRYGRSRTSATGGAVTIAKHGLTGNNTVISIEY